MARDPAWRDATARRHADGLRRCAWCSDDPLYVRYHDEEWGVPQHDDRALFEMLCLEGAQAGLSWLTVLRKRDTYRRAFADFDAVRIVRYGARERARLMADPGIVRNRLKIEAFVANARAYLDVLEHEGSFDAYLWQAVDGRPVRNRWTRLGQIPVTSPASDALSKRLAKRGFKFVGSTIVYAFMQAVGMVEDHQTGCHAKPRAGRA